MTLELDLEETERKMRELLDARMNSVRELVKSRQLVTELRAQLNDAESEDARRYTTALTDGWSDAELRKLGLVGTDVKPRTRRTSKAPRRARSATDTTSQNADSSSISGG
jgi:Cdc6-like AAA superfamily ATPase